MKDFFKKNLIILTILISFFGGFNFASAQQIENAAGGNPDLNINPNWQTAWETGKGVVMTPITVGQTIGQFTGINSYYNDYLKNKYEASANELAIQKTNKLAEDLNIAIPVKGGPTLSPEEYDRYDKLYKTVYNPYFSEAINQIAQEKGDKNEQEIAQSGSAFYTKLVNDSEKLARAIVKGDVEEIKKAQENYDKSYTRARAMNAAQIKAVTLEKCEITNLKTCLNYALVYGGGVIRQMVAELLQVVGELFDFSIDFSIKQISKITEISAIVVVWKVLRDFTNMFFIFVMLYIAIGTITQRPEVDYRKMIITVITAAILINFSMAFVKIIMDAANIFALFFYKAASGGAPSLAAKIINSMGFDRFLGLSDAQIAGSNTAAIMGTLIGDIIVMSIAIYILVEASILLISRTVIVIYYLAISPVPYLAMIIPRIGGLIGNFWGNLVNNALYAPAYMALLYLVTQVLACGNEVFNLIGSQTADITTNISAITVSGALGINKALTETPQLTGNIADNFGYVKIALFYIFSSMMMLKASSFAKEFGIAGADYAKSAAEKVSGLVPGMFASGAGVMGRNILGRAAQSLSESDWMKRREAGTFGRTATSLKEFAIKPMAAGSFDVRATRAAEVISKATGIDMGPTMGKGGYEQTQKEEKDYGKMVKGLKTEVKDIDTLEKFNKSSDPKERIDTFRSIRDKKKIKLDEYFKEIGDDKRMLIDDFGPGELGELNKNEDLTPDQRKKMKDTIIKRLENCDNSIVKYMNKNNDKFGINDDEYDKAVNTGKCKVDNEGSSGRESQSEGGSNFTVPKSSIDQVNRSNQAVKTAAANAAKSATGTSPSTNPTGEGTPSPSSTTPTNNIASIKQMGEIRKLKLTNSNFVSDNEDEAAMNGTLTMDQYNKIISRKKNG